MRLIDADKIGEVSADPYEEGAFQDEIRSQPTVEAIPVEWIEERLKKALSFTHSKAEGNIIDDGCVVTVVSASFTAQVLSNLLEDWEKENEESLVE